MTFRQPEHIINKPLVKKCTLWDKRFIIESRSKKQFISVGPLGQKDYLNMIKLKKITKSNIHHFALKTLPAIRDLDEIVYVPHLNYSKSKYWEKNVNIRYLYNKKLQLIEKY